MALVSGEQEYSSPAKRLKLDQTQHLSNSNVELDFGTFSAPIKNVHGIIKGQYSVTAEVLSSTDSGYNDSPSTSCSDNSGQSSSSVLGGSTHSFCGKDSSVICDGFGKSEEEEDDDDDKDEVSSTVSDLSNLSGLSDLSGQDWKPMAGPMSWVQRQMLMGADPRSIICQLMGYSSHIPQSMDDLTLWKIIVNMLSEPPRRQKLRHINTLADVVRLLRGANRIIVLTGAGVSVSCGIPDFRSRDGIYSRLALDFPDLPDPQAMFNIQYFSRDPRPFFKFAREIYPGQFKPSPCHRFIKMLEKHNKLLRNYSQNIDTLEQVAGIKNVIECHGSFATASCTRCKYKVTADAIRADIFAQKIPLCPQCSNHTESHAIDNEGYSDHYKDLVQQGIMKPDIVFFGEGLPEVFHDSMAKDKNECDLLIVIGSSLKVRPVALIPSSIPAHVPQILINREPLPSFNFDVKLLGDSDVIINQLCHMLGEEWSSGCWGPEPLTEARHLLPASCSRRSSCDDSREVCRGKLNIEPAGQAGHGTGSEAAESVDQVSVLEGSEADSLQMSMDSGVGLSSSSCSSSVVVDSQGIANGNASSGSGNGVNSGASTKERHMSVDSCTQDSGVCVSPVERRFNAVGSGRDSYEAPEMEAEAGVGSDAEGGDVNADLEGGDVNADLEALEALRACWQPKTRESLAQRLPEKSYYLMQPNTYIFPGAEVFYDPDDTDHSLSSNSAASSPSASPCPSPSISPSGSPAASHMLEDSDPEEVEVQAEGGAFGEVLP